MHHLVGSAELAQMLGLSRQRVSQLTREKGFPDPAAVLKAGQVWRTEDIEDWARKTGRELNEL